MCYPIYVVYIKILDKESIWPKEEGMGRRDHCCVGTCNNDTRYSERYEIKNHVTTLKFHRFPTNDEAKRNAWAALVNKAGLVLLQAMEAEFVLIISQMENPHPVIRILIFG